MNTISGTIIASIAAISTLAFTPSFAPVKTVGNLHISGNYRGESTLFPTKSAYVSAQMDENRLNLTVQNATNIKEVSEINFDFKESFILVNGERFECRKSGEFAKGEINGVRMSRKTDAGFEFYCLTSSEGYLSLIHQTQSRDMLRVISKTKVIQN